MMFGAAADAELRFALNLPQRDGALLAAMEAVADRLAREQESLRGDPAAGASRRARVAELHQKAQWAIDQIKEVRFRAVC
jgi:hypothetical protein